ncbi:SURF1 family protein [Mesorhizobium sp. BR1-1-16]|uniref:SURF1 family protein n=1 Tax=Mesorhizobium sp. BR1-1-16 TaxID=2876653 RepID=UPI001CC9DDC6|nr:SURF1 family protein [Mesorhizobium sp. BR1-1-16]MBZ9938927.1 SURF1 family protein [Mesorhizobium sp. BR1-1-16]
MTSSSGPGAPHGGAGPQIPPAAAVPRRRLTALIVAGCCAVLVLTALGTWQLQRRSWKLDLIHKVEQRVDAAPVAAPDPAAWPMINARDDAYRHVALSGRFLNDRETLVQAVTERGSGFWVMTPFATDWGFTVLVNRGFVPGDRRDPATRREGQIAGDTAFAGLMRMSEPGGAFLRANDPAAGRWYSRDVAAIAAAKGLGPVAPYFVDADATENPGGLPVGGLTVIAFPNNHLIYALTWFGMAILLAGALVHVVRSERRAR